MLAPPCHLAANDPYLPFPHLSHIQERILSEISYSAPERVSTARASGQGQERVTYVVDEAQVDEVMAPLLKKQDLSRYVL